MVFCTFAAPRSSKYEMNTSSMHGLTQTVNSPNYLTTMHIVANGIYTDINFCMAQIYEPLCVLINLKATACFQFNTKSNK